MPIKTFIHKQDVQLLDKDELNKLKGYSMIDLNDLEVGDHFRYSSNKYKELGRKLAYAIVKRIEHQEDGSNLYYVNGYSPNGENQFPDWKIDINNKYKNYIFYQKIKRISNE